MIERVLKSKLVELAGKYPIVTLTGPRQSGKSTLLKATFPDYHYVSLENSDIRLFAQSDPKGFLATYPDKTIIDEAQLYFHFRISSYLMKRLSLKQRMKRYSQGGIHVFMTKR